MKWLRYLVIVIGTLIGLTFLIGYALPARTTAARSITVPHPPAAVFAVLADSQRMAQWDRKSEKVEMLPPVRGREAMRQTFTNGTVITVVTTESAPPYRLVRSLVDENNSFVGSWTYDISSIEGGTKVVLTEVADFRNPLFRTLARVFGQAAYLEEHLRDLAKRLGETAQKVPGGKARFSAPRAAPLQNPAIAGPACRAAVTGRT